MDKSDSAADPLAHAENATKQDARKKENAEQVTSFDESEDGFQRFREYAKKCHEDLYRNYFRARVTDAGEVIKDWYRKEVDGTSTFLYAELFFTAWPGFNFRDLGEIVDPKAKTDAVCQSDMKTLGQ